MTDSNVTTDDPTPIPTALNVSELAKKFGVSIRRRLKRGWRPPTTVSKPRKASAASAPPDPPLNAPHAPLNAPPSAPLGRTVTVATLVAAQALATCSAAFSISGLNRTRSRHGSGDHHSSRLPSKQVTVEVALAPKRQRAAPPRHTPCQRYC
jgi:hypothetical protein